jgi:arsenite methyltransferase
MNVREDLTTADITATVNERYGSYAAKANGGEHEREAHANIARAFGYAQEELKAIPDRANLGLSCGNPFALANLKEVSVP